MSNIINKIRLSGTDYTLSATSSGGASAVEVTQAEYDALVSGGTVDPNTFYIITDGEMFNPSGKVDTSAFTEFSGSVETALSGKQDTLSAGTGIDITDNVISATGGGGSSYTAGRGIDITNDTISFSLPISAGTGTNSIIEGRDTTASGRYSHAEGYNSNAQAEAAHAEGFSTAKGNYCHSEGFATQAYAFRSHAEGAESVTYGDTSHAEGKDTRTYNHAEHASGRFNVSSSASTTFGDSGNTLFSVGNGTDENNRHNAFEIRQNGDIYLTKDGQDVKLQDQLGGGGSTYTAGDGIDITNDVISVTGKASTSDVNRKQDTLVSGTNIKTINGESLLGSGNITIDGGGTIDQSVISGSTNAVSGGAVYTQLGGLKLQKITQSAYDALATKDANTLYVING